MVPLREFLKDYVERLRSSVEQDVREEHAESLACEDGEERDEELTREFDAETERERKDWEEESRQKREEFDQRHALRYSVAVYCKFVLGSWLFFCMLSVFLNRALGLSDTVLVTLLGTATANLIAVFLVIVKSLFPSDSSADEASSKKPNKGNKKSKSKD